MTLMRCDGVNKQGYNGYNAHPWDSQPYVKQVPFIEAIHNPPTCERHHRPYLTEGGMRLSQLVEAVRKRGEIVADCRVDYGLEQAAWCFPHGFGGRAADFDSDRHCPHWRLAQWLIRRHAQPIEEPQ